MKRFPNFSKEDGLIVAVAQDFRSKDVLMLAWMNQTAWEATLAEGRAVYWSRSRQCLWRKGETSGNQQRIKEIILDCDNDAVLLKVEQLGKAACHTGRRSCFYKRVDQGRVEILSQPLFDPSDIYPKES